MSKLKRMSLRFQQKRDFCFALCCQTTPGLLCSAPVPTPRGRRQKGAYLEENNQNSKESGKHSMVDVWKPLTLFFLANTHEGQERLRITIFDCNMNFVEWGSQCRVCSYGMGQELVGRSSREVALPLNKKGFSNKESYPKMKWSTLWNSEFPKSGGIQTETHDH